MEGIREMARINLARSLRTLAEEDRLALALPAVCGSALAAHCAVGHLDEQRRLHLSVDGPQWMSSLLGMREMLQHDLARVAGVPLAGLHFEEAGAVQRRPEKTPWSPSASHVQVSRSNQPFSPIRKGRT